MNTKELAERYLGRLESANKLIKQACHQREEVKTRFLHELDLIPMDTIKLTLPPTKYPYIQSGQYVIAEMDMMLTGECLCLRVRDMDCMEYDVQIPVKSLDKMVKVIRRDI